MKRMIWLLLALACWVLCAIFSDTKVYPSVTFFLAAGGWLFLAIFFGGKKGLAFGLIPVVFVGVIYFAWFFYTQSSVGLFKQPFNVHESWMRAKAYLDTLENKPLALVGIYVGLIIFLLGILVIPVVVGKRVWKSAEKKTEEKKVAEEKEEKKVRGRSRF